MDYKLGREVKGFVLKYLSDQTIRLRIISGKLCRMASENLSKLPCLRTARDKTESDVLDGALTQHPNQL